MENVKVLIIDDNKDSADVLGRLLKHEHTSYQIINHPSLLNQDAIMGVNIIFLDLDMPDLDGYQTFQLLRHQLEFHNPIIAYTVNTNEKATIRQVGFNGMIAKPIDFNCFHMQWQRILDGESVWDDC